jgi:hypothetical protein
MQRTFGILGALAALAIGAQPRIAHSCSCVRPTIRRAVLPKNGSTGFPTDGVLRIFVTGGLPEALRRRLAHEYRLIGPDGKPVALASSLAGTRLDLVPKKPLRPTSRHVLEQVFAFDPSGQRITDTQRWRLAWQPYAPGAPRPKIRRAWFPVLAFHTGPGASARKPPAPTIQRAEVCFAYGGGDCGPGTALSLDYDLPAQLEETDVVELRVRGKGLVATFLPERRQGNKPGYTAYVGDMLCTPDKVHLGFNGPFVARLQLRSVTGQLSLAGPWKRARVRHRQPPRPIRGRYRPPSMTDAVERWFADPLVVAKARVAAGPAGCPHGLESQAQLPVSTSGAYTSYEATGSASWYRDQGATVVGEKGSSTLLTFGEGKPPTRTVLQGSASHGQLLVEGQALYVAGVAHVPERKGAERQPPKILVTRHGPDGKALWKRALVGPGGVSNTKPRLVMGDPGLLVVWEHWPDYGGSHNLHWALLAPRTGRVIHQRQTAGPAASSDTHPGLAHIGGRFYVVYVGTAGLFRMARKPSLLVLDKRGRERTRKDLDLADAGPNFDLVAHDGKLALVFSTRRGPSGGLVGWALLNSDGKRLVGPVTVSRGVGNTNRKPRITARGGLFAVAWEAYPARTLHAAAVDRRGVVSPPLQLAPGLRVSTVGLAPTPDGFLATCSVDWSALRAELLRCRQRAAFGPPTAIAPIKE